MRRTLVVWLVAIAGLAALPFLGMPVYLLHIAVQILLWGTVYTAWALMGRFGMMSLGHGGFLGIGAYVPALLWNYYGITPWIGIPLGVALAVLVAVAIGFPCFHLRGVGHYFALVTLQMLFAAVVGGMYTALGPTMGSALTIILMESLRILFGTRFIGAANTIYGILLIVFTIFMPVGIWRTGYHSIPSEKLPPPGKTPPLARCAFSLPWGPGLSMNQHWRGVGLMGSPLDIRGRAGT
jgi:ABC-type branched-subunit amino acid transport system permease subunit